MVLPALQVRVPSPANALLQAEQVKGVRAQAAERQQAAQQRNALLTASQGADLSTPGGQQQVVNALAGIDPLAATQLQLRINEARQAPAGFTLSPGAARFNAAGEVVAERPAAGQAAPRPFVIGDRLVSPQGDVLAEFPPASRAPQTDAGKIASDLQNGLITPAQALRLNQRLLQSGGTSVLSPGQSVVNTTTGAVIASIPPEAAQPPRPLTLSPGQAIVDVNGNVIAERPAGPAAGFTLPPGATRFDAEGNPVAAAPAAPRSGFSLQPGGTRFDAQGNPIASIPATPPQPTAFDQRVSELKLRGFTEQEAQDIAAGRLRMTPPDQFGNVSLVNTATGTRQPVAAAAPAVPLVTSEERGRLTDQNAAINRVLGLTEDMADDAAAATGVRGALGATINVLAGLRGRNAPVPADEIAAARQEIRLRNRQIMAALALNPRFPVAEMSVLQAMLPNPERVLTNPSEEFNKVVQLRDFLLEVRAQNNTSLGVVSEGSLTPEEQAELDALRLGDR